jgi:hypothetical protein
MSTAGIIGLVVVVALIAVFAIVSVRISTQRRELRERYGDEYDRVVADKGGRAAAEAELKRRDRRHAELQLSELSPEARERYRTTWTDLQAQFVDDPKLAVHAADQLVSKLVADRGYPVVDFEDRLSHLSVEHSGMLNRYRETHDISVRNDAGTATTEELRQALVGYRELISELLGEPVAEPAGPGEIATAPTVSDAQEARDDRWPSNGRFDDITRAIPARPPADRDKSDVDGRGTAAPDAMPGARDDLAERDGGIEADRAVPTDRKVPTDRDAIDGTGATDHDGRGDAIDRDTGNERDALAEGDTVSEHDTVSGGDTMTGGDIVDEREPVRGRRSR